MSTILTIPFPDGRYESFRVEASPVITKPLESSGFETLTYKGVGIDDPSATIRFEDAFDGFHAMVRSSKGVFYIDPTAKNSQRNLQTTYFSYFARAKREPIRKLHCQVSSEQTKKNRGRAVSRRSAKSRNHAVSFVGANKCADLQARTRG